MKRKKTESKQPRSSAAGPINQKDKMALNRTGSASSAASRESGGTEGRKSIDDARASTQQTPHQRRRSTSVSSAGSATDKLERLPPHNKSWVYMRLSSALRFAACCSSSKVFEPTGGHSAGDENSGLRRERPRYHPPTVPGSFGKADDETGLQSSGSVGAAESLENGRLSFSGEESLGLLASAPMRLNAVCVCVCVCARARAYVYVES